MKEYKIAILGIGGVGGYIGAKLAHTYHDSQINISFLARGENAIAIKKNGLKLTTDNSQFIAFPSVITSNPSDLQNIDLFIVCTKTYQVEEVIREVLPGNENAIFLVLLNGVDNREKIKQINPSTRVVSGCIYLSSRRTAPGEIRQSGTLNQLYFGDSKVQNDELRFIEKTLQEADINATLCDDIAVVCWEKFLFISAIATITSYLDLNISQIVRSESNKSLLIELLKELKLIADAKGIRLPTNVIDTAIGKATKMPENATSSMHTDYQRGNPVELESLTGYVVKQGEELGIPTPHYHKMYDFLLLKSKS